jgi:hypothetical protein
MFVKYSGRGKLRVFEERAKNAPEVGFADWLRGPFGLIEGHRSPITGGAIRNSRLVTLHGRRPWVNPAAT